MVFSVVPPQPSSLDVAAAPWVFTQSEPLSTAEFIRAADRRGVSLDHQTLEALHSRGVLSPMFAVHATAVAPPAVPDPTRPPIRGTYACEFVEALAEGRLTDPSIAPLPSGWRFDSGRATDPQGWWNGLLYSTWQLLQLDNLAEYLASGRREPDRSVVFREPDELILGRARRSRIRALILTAIEARYLPNLRPHILSLRNAEDAEWLKFRADFDSAAVARKLGITAEQLRNEADGLLARAHHIDPLGSWYDLIRHAPPKQWDGLKGISRLAMDLRVAAELLLLFSEDLAGGGRVADPTGFWWTPLHERLSRRVEPLERVLANHGVAPGPRVVIIVEGQSELVLARRICDFMDIDLVALQVRIISARGAGGLGATKDGLKPVSRLAAHLLTPVIADRLGDSYTTLQPLCRVMIAVDPSDLTSSSEGLAKRLVDEAEKNLRDQDVQDVDRGALEHLLKVYTWREEFEFAHFSDIEIARALTSIDPTLGGKTPEEIGERLARFRDRRVNIEHVWQDWTPSVSKVELAERLWPTLEAQIQQAKNGKRGLPEIAALLWSARNWAVGQSMVNYVLPARDQGVAGAR